MVCWEGNFWNGPGVFCKAVLISDAAVGRLLPPSLIFPLVVEDIVRNGDPGWELGWLFNYGKNTFTVSNVLITFMTDNTI